LESKTNYTIVGLVVLLLLAALLSAGLWLSVGFNQKEYTNYTVYLSESVAGLSEQSPVKFNGVQVGFVKKIQLNTNDPRQVELTLSVEKDIPITTSTTATLISQGITGVANIGLAASSSELTPIKRMEGEPYPVIPARPSLFNQIDSIIKDVSENVNKLSVQTQKIFNQQNAQYIQETLANIDEVTSVLSKNSKNLQDSIHNMDVFLANLAKISNEFPGTVTDFRQGVKKFNSLANYMSTASQDVSKAMMSGKNTFEQLSQQTVPSITTLLQRLNTISANLEQVSNEMRQNPSVVVRGTAPPKKGPGE